VRKSIGKYPPNWKEIAKEVKDRADWVCVRCGHPHDPGSGYTLTVHHADGDKSNGAWWNLLPLCQRCHLQIQAKVELNRPWLFEHSAWFKPYAGGYFAWKYLGLRLTRAQILADLDYYAGLEVAHLLADG
jgi:5-methylcytosine-specific restriction endonuclease McrA